MLCWKQSCVGDSKWLHHFNAWLVPYCLSHARAKRTLQASSGWRLEKRGEIIKKEGGRKNAMPGLFSFVFRKWSTIHFAAKVLKSLASVKKGCCLRERVLAFKLALETWDRQLLCWSKENFCRELVIQSTWKLAKKGETCVWHKLKKTLFHRVVVVVCVWTLCLAAFFSCGPFSLGFPIHECYFYTYYTQSLVCNMQIILHQCALQQAWNGSSFQ